MPKPKKATKKAAKRPAKKIANWPAKTAAKKSARPAAKKTARKAPRKAAKRPAPARGRKAPRRNPDAADALYTDFHGKAPTRTTIYEDETRFHAKLAQLGRLVELRVLAADRQEYKIGFEGLGVILAASPNGKQLYFVGGSQQVNLADLAMKPEGKDKVILGICTRITYHTAKGFHDFAPTNYWHKFGEENGVKPILTYDVLNQDLELIGGDYRVTPRGIEN